MIVGGTVSGTWSLATEEVVISWFTEAAPPAQEAVADEVAKLATILDRPLQPTLRLV